MLQLVRVNPGRLSILLALVFLLASCAAPIPLKVSPGISEVGVSLEFNDEFVPEPLRQSIEQQFADFIIKHNSRSSKLRVYEELNSDSADLVFKVAGYKPVTSGQNTAGVFVSLIGLIAVPAIMISSEAEFFFFFWYFPKSRSLSELHVRRNLNSDNPPWIPGAISSGGFLVPPDRQMSKHAVAYHKYFLNVMVAIEKQLPKK